MIRSATMEAVSSAACAFAKRLSRVSAKASVAMRSSRRAGISFSGASDMPATIGDCREQRKNLVAPGVI